ncbi:hypothetical protein GJAV_G00261420 [Gymnothorax javanicus]|nr:hypothetical protein GJAV_G00261420 [Gymnothorax javanicus]
MNATKDHTKTLLKMGAAGVHIVCIALGVIGLVAGIVCCALPRWKVTSFTGNNIVTAQLTQAGLWMECVVQSTGQQQCKKYESMLVLDSDLQAARAMTIISCFICSISILILFAGSDFTTCVENEDVKPKITLVAGIGMIIAGLMLIIPVSWSAHNVVRNFNNPMAIQKYELGACIFVGWAGGVLMLLAGIPLLCFLVLIPQNIPWSQTDVTWLGLVHFLACLSPEVFSVLYHLFMNHEGGAPVYRTLLSLDMFGVCMVNTLGALPIVYITFLCYPTIRNTALFAYILLSIYGVYSAVTAQSNIRRLRSFLWQALFRFFLFMLRWSGVGTGSFASLRHFLTMDFLAILGGVVNISRIPERFQPGLFDYWCNSHQIMHVLVVVSIVFLHWGMVEDLLWLSDYQCPSE